MRNTRDLGRLFVTLLDNPSKFLEKTSSQMVEPPYRAGVGIALRFSRTKALVVGWWGPRVEVDEEDDDADDRYSVRGRSIEDITVEEIASW